MPQSSGEWRLELNRLQSEHSRLETAITAEASRRAQLAVAARTDATVESQFQASFVTETELRRELERTAALFADAEHRLKVHAAE